MKNKIIAVISCLLIIICLTGCGFDKITQKDDSEKYNVTIETEEGITVKTYMSAGESQMIVSIKNKTGERIGSGFIYMYFYDENGNKIYNMLDFERYTMLGNDQETICRFELPQDKTFNYIIPARVKVRVTIDKDYQRSFKKSISEYTDKFTYSYSVSNNKIKIGFKNNSNRDEFAPDKVSIVYYKNGRPVHSDEGYLLYLISKEVKAGKIDYNEFSIPYDIKKSKETKKLTYIDYDSIKIIKLRDN